MAILKNSCIMNSSWCLCPCLPYFHTHPHDHMCFEKLPINFIRRPQRVFSIPCRDTSRLSPEPANLYWFVYQWGYTARKSSGWSSFCPLKLSWGYTPIFRHAEKTHRGLFHFQVSSGQWSNPNADASAWRFPLITSSSEKKMKGIYKNLGKLQYFTNLNLAAIWGWFPLKKTWFQGSVEQWGRYNLPRYMDG